MKTLGVIDCFSSTGSTVGLSPERLARSRIQGQSLITWLASRVVQSQRLDQLVVVVRSGSLAPLENLVPSYASVVESTAATQLEMIVAVSLRCAAAAVVRVGIDNPLVDPLLIDYLVEVSEAHPECDYIGYRALDGRPVGVSRFGIFAEWFRVSALSAALQIDREGGQKGMTATLPICEHPQLLHRRLIPMPDAVGTDRLHFTVDIPDDLDSLDEIIDALGPDSLDWSYIAGLVRRTPLLRERLTLQSEAALR